MTVHLRLLLALRRIGWLPLAAAMRLVTAIWLHFVMVAAANDEARRIQSEIAALAEGPFAPPAEPLFATRLTAFRAALLERSALPGVAQSIADEAVKANLGIDQADYKLSPWPDGDFLAYRISLPVRGAYANIRQFVDGFLAALPAAALTEVDFKRESAGAANIDAKLEFVVFVKGGSAS